MQRRLNPTPGEEEISSPLSSVSYEDTSGKIWADWVMRSGRGRKKGRAQARDKVAGETETEGVGWVSSEKKKKKSKSSEITLTAVVKSGMIRLENVHETLHNILLEFVF